MAAICKPWVSDGVRAGDRDSRLSQNRRRVTGHTEPPIVDTGKQYCPERSTDVVPETSTEHTLKTYKHTDLLPRETATDAKTPGRQDSRTPGRRDVRTPGHRDVGTSGHQVTGTLGRQDVRTRGDDDEGG